jgi:hypothetical protein
MHSGGNVDSTTRTALQLAVGKQRLYENVIRLTQRSDERDCQRRT